MDNLKLYLVLQDSEESQIVAKELYDRKFNVCLMNKAEEYSFLGQTGNTPVLDVSVRFPKICIPLKIERDDASFYSLVICSSPCKNPFSFDNGNINISYSCLDSLVANPFDEILG